jgi:hypothetical protein
MPARSRIRHPERLGGFGEAAELGCLGENLELQQPVHFFAYRKRDLQILGFISASCKAKYP